MPYDPNDPPKFLGKYSKNKQRQWCHVFNSVLEDTGDEGRARAAAFSVIGKVYTHKRFDVEKIDDIESYLDALSREGWEVIGLSGNTLLARKSLDDDIQKDNAPATGAYPTISMPGNMRTYQTPVTEGERMRDRPLPSIHFWGMVPNTEAGEKRFEAKTSMAEGLTDGEHDHKVVVIVDKDRNVLRGVTDFYSQHAHFIRSLQATEETDGHVHTFEVLEDRPKHGDTKY